jgi:hypothetical protein
MSPWGRLEFHAEQATESIEAMFGLLAGHSECTASLNEIQEAAAAGWASRRNSSICPGAASAAGPLPP